MIRFAQVADVISLSDIEHAADAAFIDEDMATIANGGTMSIPDFLRELRADTARSETGIA